MNETVQKWDELSLLRKIVAIGGIDAHAHKVNLLGLFEVEVFPYKVLFKSIRTHILMREKIEIRNSPREIQFAVKNLLASLEAGCCFVANDYIYDSRGFRFWAEAGSNVYEMGDKIAAAGKVNLYVEVPADTPQVRIIRNGTMIGMFEKKSFILEVDEPGIYRVEVYLHNKAWIFSNHIRFGI